MMIKAGMGSFPDFIIVGAQKAGTSGLFKTLAQHPELQGSGKKEVHFFDNDDWYGQKNWDEYQQYFPLKPLYKGMTFESTPSYLYHPSVAYRLYKFNPHLKIIIMLREPAHRAFSAWKMYHFKTHDNITHARNYDPRSFDEAIDQEMREIENTSYYSNFRSYVKRGIYHEQVRNYLQYFSKDQIYFLETRDFKENKNERLNDISRFLGIKEHNLPMVISNQSKIDRSEDYQDTIRRLKHFYKNHNRKLYDLLGQDYGWS